MGATRQIGNQLVHETQQKPSDLPDEMRHGDSHGNPMDDPNMSSEDKHVSGQTRCNLVTIKITDSYVTAVATKTVQYYLFETSIISCCNRHTANNA